MTKKKRLLVALVLVFTGLQFIRPELSNPPVTGDFDAPPEVKAIIKRACYDCHSNETNLRWYDQVSPVYWRVASHVKDGRQGLNFSNWTTMAPADQKAKLWEAVNQAAIGAMPLKDYQAVHPGAKVSAADIQVLKNYLAGMVHEKPADALAYQPASTPAPDTLPVSINGIRYIPGYKNWTPVSTTDRFDNGTMRVIFGNDVAIKAIKDNKINPWPNGTIFAKVAWDKLSDEEGNIRTGAFKQVEYMIKDSEKYKSTAGWGFARFKTPKLEPYGKTVLFTRECVSCHKPMEANDFVFTQPLQH